MAKDEGITFDLAKIHHDVQKLQTMVIVYRFYERDSLASYIGVTFKLYSTVGHAGKILDKKIGGSPCILIRNALYVKRASE